MKPKKYKKKVKKCKHKWEYAYRMMVLIAIDNHIGGIGGGGGGKTEEKEVLVFYCSKCLKVIKKEI